MNTLITGFILPLCGILILVFSILSFFFPYGQRFKEKTQKFKGFGVDMEVSVLTLFIIVGVAMSFAGIYLQVRDYEGQLASAKADALAAQMALEQGRKMQMTVLVTLEDTHNTMPRLEDLKAGYYLFGANDPVVAEVTKGIASDQFRIILKDITSSTVIRSLVVEDLATKRKWTRDNFAPFEPNFMLGRSQ